MSDNTGFTTRIGGKATAIILAVLIVGGSLAGMGLFSSPVGTVSAGHDTGTSGVQFHDDFEDEAADTGVPGRWEAFNTSTVDTQEVVSGIASNGTQSFHVVESSADNIHAKYRPAEQPYDSPRLSNVTVSFNRSSNSATDASIELHLYDDDNDGQDGDVELHSDGLKVRHNSSTTTLSSAVSDDEWIEIEVFNINPTTDTYSVSWSSPSDSGTATGIDTKGDIDEGYTESRVLVEGEGHVDDLKINRNIVAGQVTDRTGDPCANCTVKVYGFDYAEYNGTQEEIQDEIDEIQSKMANPTPDGWASQGGMDFQLVGDGGHFESAANDYVAVHTKEDWGLKGYDVGGSTIGIDTVEIDQPQIQTAASETVVLTLWNPEEQLTEDAVDSDLPGYTTSGEVVVEHRGVNGSVMDRNTWQTQDLVRITSVRNIDYGGSKTHEAIVLDLDPGFYRVYPKGGEEMAYWVVVGSSDDLIHAYVNTLKDEKNELTNQSKYYDSLRQNGKIEQPLTTTTDEHGRWSIDLGPQVEEVQATAFRTPPGMDPQEATRSDVVQYYASYTVSQNSVSFDGAPENVSLTEHHADERLPGSVYLPAGVKTVSDVPQTGVDLTVEEVVRPPYLDMNATQNRSELLKDALRNSNLSIAPLLQDLNATRGQLESAVGQLQNLTEENQRLRQRFVDLLQNRTGGNESVSVTVDVGNASDQELRDRMWALQQSLNQLRTDIDTLETSSSTGDNTVSSTAVFDAALEQSQVTVIADYSNGSTQVVDDEFVSVDRSTGMAVGVGSTTVRVENYPLGDAAPGSVSFRYEVATADGLGSARETVENPTVSEAVPALESVRLSTLNPGPDETVQVTVNGDSDSTFEGVTAAEVYAPNGTQLNSSAVSSDSFNFTTAGPGIHTLKMTINSDGGRTYTETVRVRASPTDRDYPPSIRPVSGPLGMYVLAGDGLSGGTVDVQTAGEQADVVARLPAGEHSPADVHVYTESANLAPDATIDVSVVKGSADESVQKHVGVVVHTQNLDEGNNPIAYRVTSDGKQPITEDGTQYGTINYRDDGAAIKTYTESDGQVEIRTINDPTLVQRGFYLYRVNVGPVVPDIPLASFFGGEIAGLGAAAMILVGGRRLFGRME